MSRRESFASSIGSRSGAAWVFCAIFLVSGAFASLPVPPVSASTLVVATIDGSINPASADYLMAAIEEAESSQAAALLIELDTPGGLVSSTQDIIQKMLNAKVPIIVFVTPRGAWAASAGTFITLASTVAAMTPGSSIGAAHPVSAFGGGGESKPGSGGAGKGDSESTSEGARDFAAEKAENFLAAYVESIAKQKDRNVEWAVDAVRNSVAITADEAVELGVIDLVAKDRADLIEQIEGRTVQVDGEEQTLVLASATPEPFTMSPVQRIFNFLADPNVAVILFALGALGLYMEFQAPGMIVPGALGLACLILAGFAFQILPFSWIGLALIVLGIGLLIAELFITSAGLLFVAGITCFLIGGTMVFERPELSDLTVSFWETLVPMAAALTIFGGTIGWLVAKSIMSPLTAGLEEMIGLVGKSEGTIDGEGRVFIRGESWKAMSEAPIEAGVAVEVVSVEGLTVHVRPAAAKQVS